MTTVVTIDQGAMGRVEARLARDGMGALGEQLAATARSLTPVDTGRLRDGMWAAVYVDGREVWSEGPVPSGIAPGPDIQLLVGNDVEYARYVHDGTVDTPQHPFLAGALAAVRARAAGIVADGIR